MGLPETIFGVGEAILLAAIVYGVMRAGRAPQSRVSIEATKQNFDKAE